MERRLALAGTPGYAVIPSVIAGTPPWARYERGVAMKGFVQNIEGLAVKNDEFRRVLYTAKHCQLVVMALKPKEEIGAEVHKLDQFFWRRGPVRRFSTAFGRRSERASLYSSRPGRITTSSIPAVFH
jgi:hypothetical protein